jgi:hypothetical protein
MERNFLYDESKYSPVFNFTYKNNKRIFFNENLVLSFFKPTFKKITFSPGNSQKLLDNSKIIGINSTQERKFFFTGMDNEPNVTNYLIYNKFLNGEPISYNGKKTQNINDNGFFVFGNKAIGIDNISKTDNIAPIEIDEIEEEMITPKKKITKKKDDSFLDDGSIENSTDGDYVDNLTDEEIDETINIPAPQNLNLQETNKKRKQTEEAKKQTKGKQTKEQKEKKEEKKKKKKEKKKNQTEEEKKICKEKQKKRKIRKESKKNQDDFVISNDNDNLNEIISNEEKKLNEKNLIDKIQINSNIEENIIATTPDNLNIEENIFVTTPDNLNFKNKLNDLEKKNQNLNIKNNEKIMKYEEFVNKV